MKFRTAFDQHRAVVVLAVCVVFSLITMTFSSTNVVVRPREFGLTVVSAFQNVFTGFGRFIASTINSVAELRELQADYDLLVEQVRRYEGLENDIFELRSEVESLRELLGFSQELQYDNIPAQIIGKDPGNLFGAITINRGSLHGVRTDMPVVAVQGGRQGLVGRVQRAGLTASTVVPLTDRSFYVASRLQRSRYEGLVSGTGAGTETISMRHVDKNARDNIAYGESVITSGLGSLYPRGIHIGTVEGIQARPYETSLELVVRPLVEFAVLEYVFVIRTNG
ncbi:MAG: rod shape-determining protein MreC [Spirochaetaceae bacterium]|nr:MAG: rod shape-determining protein MreC [Spirochaetaceae bacterium]